MSGCSDVIEDNVYLHEEEMKACGVLVSISCSGHRLQGGLGNWVG